MPKPTTKAKRMIHVRLDQKLYDAAKREADAMFIDMTSFFSLAVKEKIDAQRGKE